MASAATKKLKINRDAVFLPIAVAGGAEAVFVPVGRFV